MPPTVVPFQAQNTMWYAMSSRKNMFAVVPPQIEVQQVVGNRDQKKVEDRSHEAVQKAGLWAREQIADADRRGGGNGRCGVGRRPRWGRRRHRSRRFGQEWIH